MPDFDLDSALRRGCHVWKAVLEVVLRDPDGRWGLDRLNAICTAIDGRPMPMRCRGAGATVKTTATWARTDDGDVLLTVAASLVSAEDVDEDDATDLIETAWSLLTRRDLPANVQRMLGVPYTTSIESVEGRLT